MLVIGLTGNFGTGKTTVSQILAKLGAIVIDADKLGHLLLQPDTETYKEILTTFGKSILKPNGEIDRNKLGKLVFDDNTALTRLNQIMHPRIYDIVRQTMEGYRQAGARVVVLEAALLIEAGWIPLLDQVWVTIAPEDTVAKRLKKARGLSEEQFLARLRTQMPQQEKARRADVVINTDCSPNELRARVTELWRRLPAVADP
ncbi:MAG: dephospho-CoA kinase [Chloroflexi bacterium RBG_13_50_10]|nr:MAG: dephospho-CoA kinase [Chloroflexi bacterium RBG_13_50_10]